MFGRGNRATKVLICSLLCIFTLLSCSETTADESPIFVQADISWLNQSHEIMSSLGEIWIGYIPISGEITIAAGAGRFLIGRANFYYKVEDNFTFIGSIDEIGIHDRDGDLIRASPVTVGGGFEIAGISSLLAEHRDLTIRFIIQPREDRDYYWETEVWEFLDIDIENASIKLRDRSGFFR